MNDIITDGERRAKEAIIDVALLRLDDIADQITAIRQSLKTIRRSL